MDHALKDKCLHKWFKIFWRSNRIFSYLTKHGITHFYHVSTDLVDKSYKEFSTFQTNFTEVMIYFSASRLRNVQSILGDSGINKDKPDAILCITGTKISHCIVLCITLYSWSVWLKGWKYAIVCLPPTSDFLWGQWNLFSLVWSASTVF